MLNKQSPVWRMTYSAKASRIVADAYGELARRNVRNREVLDTLHEILEPKLTELIDRAETAEAALASQKARGDLASQALLELADWVEDDVGAELPSEFIAGAVSEFRTALAQSERTP